MKTQNSSTEKLIVATERLLGAYESERAGRQDDKRSYEERITELEATIAQLRGEISDLKEAAESHISNHQIQSPDSVALKAENIDALVEEIDACLNLLKI